MVKSQVKKVEGWVMKCGDKYWGEVYPTDHSHGGGCAQNGWTDNIEKIKISVQTKKPPTKHWFTSSNNIWECEKLSKGDWVHVKLEVQHTLSVVGTET